jgi:type I restriction enzyme R subunit
MSNFGFLPSTFREIAEPAVLAESHIMGDPRAACFHARFSLEALVHWLYRHDTSLRMPYDESLGALLHEPSFQNALPPAVFQKARVIQKQGNQAVHNGRPVRQYDALQVVKELHHICYWIARVYAPDAATKAGAWRDDLIPKPVDGSKVVPREELIRLEEKLAEQSAATLKQQQERDALDGELQQVRAELERLKAAAAKKPDPHDYDEAKTRRYLIDVDLHRAGWALDSPRDQEYEVRGMPNNQGVGYVDYVLWGDDGKPLGLVEAKKTTVDPAVGQQQAKLYADCLEKMHGQRPIIFYTNGYKTFLWDDTAYPPREVAGFYKKDELASLILRRTRKQKLDARNIKADIAGRYYQKRAIGSIGEQFEKARRKALLVMATGTGSLTKTGVADLLLTGNNTFTGSTTVSAGTLVGTTTSVQGDVVNNAELQFNQSIDGTFRVVGGPT